MSNVSGPSAGAPAHGHNSIQVRNQTTLNVTFNNNTERANFNANANAIAADALRSFTTTQQSSAPAATPGTFASLPGLDMSAWQARFNQAGEIGATLDKMESEAMNLLKSPKKEDQIKGQQMMQAMQAIMDAVIKAIQARGESMKSAIQNSTSR